MKNCEVLFECILIFILFPLSLSHKLRWREKTGSRIQILLMMDKSTGIFQIEKVSERKIRTSSIQNMVEVKVLEKGIQPEEPKSQG